MKTCLLIDNYDSFTHNIARYFRMLNIQVSVYYNDQISLQEAIDIDADMIVLSPGPGTPNDSGITMKIIEYFIGLKPMLGICLGHQCIGAFLGGRIVRAIKPMHGKISFIKHCESNIFADIKNPLRIVRYNSLVIDNQIILRDLDITAVDIDNNEIMAIRVKSLPIFGVQFHPEALMTESGIDLVSNFVNLV